MSIWIDELLESLCVEVGIADASRILRERAIDVGGYNAEFYEFEEDSDALYVNFNYGTVTAGRTLAVFRLLLEANLLVYAKDQAQVGLDPETGSVLLIVRLLRSDTLGGPMLADLLSQYCEHANYWRRHMFESTDEMFEGIAAGRYEWLRG